MLAGQKLYQMGGTAATLMSALALAIYMVIIPATPIGHKIVNSSKYPTNVDPSAQHSDGSVLVCIAGQTRELVLPHTVDLLETHVLQPLRRRYKVHTIFSVDANPALAVSRAGRYGTVISNISAAKHIFERRGYCNAYLRNVTMVEHIKWVIIARPDHLFLEDLPDLSTLPVGIHMRARVWNPPPNITRYPSFMSWDFWVDKPGMPDKKSIPCEAATADGYCVMFDDQLAIADSKSASSYLYVTTYSLPPAASARGCFSCRSPIIGEKLFTDHLLGLGCNLHVLSWQTRLARYACREEVGNTPEKMFSGVMKL